MRSPENNVFVLSYTFSMLQYSSNIIPIYTEKEFVERLGAAVLERLFAKLEWNSESRRGSVTQVYEGARRMAVSFIGQTRLVNGSLYMTVTMANFISFFEEVKESIPLGFSYYSSSIIHFSPVDFELDFNRVREHMDSVVSSRIIEYFKWNSDISTIFVKEVRLEQGNLKKGVAPSQGSVKRDVRRK